MANVELLLATRLAIASLVGLAAGLEREWSGHASGPRARFAGLRTFFLLGLLGGVAGALADASHEALGAALAAAGGALCVTAYAVTVRRADAEADGTTEAAALAVVALGAAAGAGWIGVSAGAGALLVLMLREKEPLHSAVRRLAEPELRAGLQFAVLAVVVLPLLPLGPFFGSLDVRPRALWAIVLIFSGLDFAAFVARRIAGASRGLAIAGALGGVISSTLVTLTFARRSRSDERNAPSLARGVVAACTVLVPRVLVLSAVVNAEVARALIPILAPALLVGVILVLFVWRPDAEPAAAPEDEKNPLRLGAAIRMAVAFQLAMVAVAYVVRLWGTAGVYTTAVILGLTDVDALNVSMSRQDATIGAEIAARAIGVGILSNTVFKAGLVTALGISAFRRRAVAGLAAIAGAIVLGLLVQAHWR